MDLIEIPTEEAHQVKTERGDLVFDSLPSDINGNPLSLDKDGQPIDATKVVFFQSNTPSGMVTQIKQVNIPRMENYIITKYKLRWDENTDGPLDQALEWARQEIIKRGGNPDLDYIGLAELT